MSKNIFKKYEKQINKILRLAYRLYGDYDGIYMEVLLQKLYFSCGKHQEVFFATLIKNDPYVDLIETSGYTIKKTLRKLNRALKEEMNKEPATKTNEVKIIDADADKGAKALEKANVTLNKDVEFWNKANAAEENEKKEKETTNNSVLILSDKESEQLTLPLMEKTNESCK